MEPFHYFSSSRKNPKQHFAGNLIWSTSCEFYEDDVTMTSFMSIKYGDVRTEIVS